MTDKIYLSPNGDPYQAKEIKPIKILGTYDPIDKVFKIKPKGGGYEDVVGLSEKDISIGDYHISFGLFANSPTVELILNNEIEAFYLKDVISPGVTINISKQGKFTYHKTYYTGSEFPLVNFHFSPESNDSVDGDIVISREPTE